MGVIRLDNVGKKSGEWQITTFPSIDECQEEHRQHQDYCYNLLYTREGIVYIPEKMLLEK